jgi:CMP-N-acetylneuraminic acid synthetase
MPSIVAIIPARGGSKGVPLKNLRPFLGCTLFLWQARACRDSGIFKDVYISTDDDAIKAVALDAGFKVHDRSAESATDTASSETVLLEFVEWYQAQQQQEKDDDDDNDNNKDRGNLGYVCLSQATSPLTTAADYEEAWKLLRASSADSLVTVSRTHAFYWNVNENTGDATPVNYDPSSRPRRQDWDGNWEENGAFYMTRVAPFQKSKCRLVGRVVAHVLRGEGQKYEIDSLLDFSVCETVGKFRIGAGDAIGGGGGGGSILLNKEKEQGKENGDR